MQGTDSATWTLVRPSARRREWELCRGTDALASIRIPMFRSGASVETPDRRLRIQRLGRLRARYAVIDETSGGEIAQLRFEGRRRLLDLDGLTAEWSSLGRKYGFGFVGEDGEPLVAAKVRLGLVKSSGEVKIKAGVEERTTIVAALLACYLLIRRAEEAAAGAGGTTAVVAS